jgi:hypothetical protein
MGAVSPCRLVCILYKFRSINPFAMAQLVNSVFRMFKFWWEV